MIIENLSSNNPEIIKSTLTKYKNYRSNTSENAKIQKISFQKTGSKFEGLTKNTSGIRQYFKGKSAGSLKKNSKYIQKSKEFQNLSNFFKIFNVNFFK